MGSQRVGHDSVTHTHTLEVGTYLRVQVDKGISTGLQQPLQRLGTMEAPLGIWLYVSWPQDSLLTLGYFSSLGL